jgi:glycine/D-amino acid oxidase-like deaminating enzyme
MSEAYYGIILGAGHKALVPQAYLARAGLRVLSLDRTAVAGGGLATIENPLCVPKLSSGGRIRLWVPITSAAGRINTTRAGRNVRERA